MRRNLRNDGGVRTTLAAGLVEDGRSLECFKGSPTVFQYAPGMLSEHRFITC